MSGTDKLIVWLCLIFSITITTPIAIAVNGYWGTHRTAIEQGYEQVAHPGSTCWYWQKKCGCTLTKDGECQECEVHDAE